MPARDIFDPPALESSARSHPTSPRAPRNAHRSPPKVHFPPPEREAEEIVRKDTRHVRTTVDDDDDGRSTPAPAPAVGDARVAGLLPTPPMNPAESLMPPAPSAWEDQMNGRVGQPHHRTRSSASVGTPLHPPRPPTPDITPPGDLPRLTVPQLQLPVDPRVPPSSRSESFKTAHEDPYSSDGEGREQPPVPWGEMVPAERLEDRSPTPRAQNERLDATSAALMAAVDHDDDHDQTPTQEMPGREFMAFDGAWGAESRPARERNDHEWTGNDVAPSPQKVERSSKEHLREGWGPQLQPQPQQPRQDDRTDAQDDVPQEMSMQKVTKRRRARKRGNKASAATTTTSEDEPAAAARPATPPLRRQTGKGLSLRERIEQNREAERRSSTREFAEKICWPLSVEGVPTEVPDGLSPISDGRPLSMASNASSVIEALVLSAPPPTPRRLRHAGKNIAWTKPMQGVRIVSSVLPPTHPPPLRLVHQPAIDDMKRASLASERSISPSRPERRAPEPAPESIPAVVIPERRRAAGRKLPGPILQHEKSHEDLKQARLQDEQRPRRRRVRVEESPSSSRDTIQTDQTPRANPHVDDSFRSAAGKRTMWMDDSPVNGASPRKDGADMTSYLTAGLVSRTQLSNPSTPEALEVNEATAVSIYPHNNHSLLVVRQHSRPVSQDPRLALSSSRDGPNDRSHALAGDQEPTTVIRAPPTFKIIPPTPSVMSPVDEPHRPREETKSSGSDRTRPAGVALSLVKRALGNKRYGDSFVSPFARFHHPNHHRGIDESTQTSNGAYHVVTTRRHHPLLSPRKDPTTTTAATTATTTNLSPFWRPRGFWDDFDHPSSTDRGGERDLTAKMHDEFLERGRLEEFDPRNVHHRNRPPRTASSSRSTSRGRGYDGGPVSRGSDHSNSRPSTSRTSNMDDYDGEGGTRRRRRRVYLIRPLGVQVEFVGRKGVRDRQRELEKGMIKRRISSPSPTMTSTTGIEYPAVI